MAPFQKMEHTACKLYTQTFHEFYIVRQRSNLASNISDEMQVFY